MLTKKEVNCNKQLTLRFNATVLLSPELTHWIKKIERFKKTEYKLVKTKNLRPRFHIVKSYFYLPLEMDALPEFSYRLEF